MQMYPNQVKLPFNVTQKIAFVPGEVSLIEPRNLESYVGPSFCQNPLMKDMR